MGVEVEVVVGGAVFARSLAFAFGGGLSKSSSIRFILFVIPFDGGGGGGGVGGGLASASIGAVFSSLLLDLDLSRGLELVSSFGGGASGLSSFEPLAVT